jgi:DNA transformation protein
MNRPLHRLLNLGPVTARRLREVGIADEAALRAMGAAAAYRRVKHAFPRETTMVLLYALHGALTDAHWNRLPADTKARLRRESGTP